MAPLALRAVSTRALLVRADLAALDAWILRARAARSRGDVFDDP